MQPSPRKDANTPAASAQANAGYALGQLARALSAEESTTDAEARARAAHKIKAWTQVFQGMLSGALQIGSRLPCPNLPAWVTLEVLKGGFATGRPLAGGDLQPHERELLGWLAAVPAGSERAALNAYYLGEQGLAELQQRLRTGCYRVDLPEEGALLVVAWLLHHGHAEQARNLLDAIGPFFARLRFYPVPSERPAREGTVVHLQNVGETIAQLQRVHPSPRFEQQKEAIQIWAPLYGRVVELFIETVRGPLPSLCLGVDGKPLRSATGKFRIEGGWPCQHYPAGWMERAAAVLDDYRRLRDEHRLCAAPDASKSGFSTLRRYLERCVAEPERLTGREVGLIRSILAGLAAKRGLPGSPRWQALCAHQRRQIAGPTRADLARVLIERLSAYPSQQGLDSVEEMLAPIDPAESERFRIPAGAAISGQLGLKVRRCLEAPVDTLVAQRIIPSAEILARVIPQLTAQVQAAGIADADLRRLDAAIYAAFRRRRSLLLLNLQSQVKRQELPWVQAIDRQRTPAAGCRPQARLALTDLVVLVLTAFPQQILPNKFLQEARALAERAGLRLPLIAELAADIFMGQLAAPYLYAAHKAAAILEGSLYERYYGIPYARLRAVADVQASWWGTPTSSELGGICLELAGETGFGRHWSVARNGKIIEQVQIVTTHNLAVLFDALGLAEMLRPRLSELAIRCFDWICRRLQQKSPSWRAQLQGIKNSAYAWRQMIFFLTLAPAGTIDSFLFYAEDRLRKQKADFRDRFYPALHGLTRAVQGLPVEDSTAPARRFLGWTTERHWLLV